MQDAPLVERVVVDPNVCGGRPVIKGHRIWVSLILGLLAEGLTIEEILAEYPGLEEADIRAAIAYGARLAGVRFVDLV